MTNETLNEKGIYEKSIKPEGQEWVNVYLDYRVYNFKESNRKYDENVLFWLAKVNDYELEPPSSEDDLTP